MKVLSKNRRAGFDYDLSEHLIAGLALTGNEVKSMKAGYASLKGSFITLRGQEAYLMGAHVTPYAHAAHKADIDPTRQRKLLLHRRQLSELQQAKDSGHSIVPTALLLDRNFVKLEIAIGRGKKRYDKRETIKQRDTNREIAREVSGRHFRPF
jgi:SsrA-binding protein